MLYRLPAIALACFGLSIVFAPSTANADHQRELAGHAFELRHQAHAAHTAIEYQFVDSPYGFRLCRLAREVEDLAARLEEEVLSGCNERRSRHLVGVLDRRVRTLYRTFDTANYRASVGIDPPIGCTLALTSQMDAMVETVRCMKVVVEPRRQIQPPPADYGYGRSSCPPPGSGYGYGSHRNSISYSSGGLTLQHGSIRFTIGR